MDIARAKRAARLRRHRRVRRRVAGTAERPRLAVFRSNRQIYAQLIDDRSGRTLAAAGSLPGKGDGDKKTVARRVGAELATKATAAFGRWPRLPARAAWTSRRATQGGISNGSSPRSAGSRWRGQPAAP